jgi:predicted RNA-binding Zn-ribbon protein involved in translation (DUF1610 family)
VFNLEKFKEKLRGFFSGRYGMDELGKSMFLISMILYVLGCLIKNVFVIYIAFFGLLICVYRSFSRKTYDRMEENCKYAGFLKLWKARYENRKTSRVYMCPTCGTLIRVPKKKGKIQITCPNCCREMIKRT